VAASLPILVVAETTKGAAYLPVEGLVMSPVPTTLTTLRSTLADRRSAHRARTRLERELAGYDTPSARRELDAILARHTAEEIAPIEKILNRQSVGHARRAGGSL
jgi:hypothetical protein